MINPALQLAGNTEVVHGQAQHDVIRHFQFVNQCHGKRVHPLLIIATLIRRGKEGPDALAVQVRNRVCGEITDHHRGIRMLRFQRLHLGVDQRGRITVIAENTAFNDQNIHDINSFACLMVRSAPTHLVDCFDRPIVVSVNTI